MSAKEIIRKYKIVSKNDKLLNIQKNTTTIMEDLKYLKELVNESLEKEKLIFSVTSRDNLDLTQKIFGKVEQYTFGDEDWHYYRVFINKKSLKKLEKMINKTSKRLQAINKQVEELGWNND